MLTMAVVIPITGYLQQRFSTRGLYIAAMSAFVLGTLLGAISPNFEILLLGRIVQASGAAVMFPLLMTTIMDLVPEQSRGRIMGNIGIVMSVAPALGPAVSGIILNSLEWRWLFIVMLPIGLVTSTIGAIKLRASHTPNKASIDLLSVAYSILAFGGLVYGLSSFAEAARGEAAVSPWLLVALGAAFMALFVARQIKLAKTDRALLNLRTFKSGNFRIGIALMLISMLVMFGFMILLPIYMQDGLGMSAMTAGFVLLPGGLTMGLLSPVIGALYDKFGCRTALVHDHIQRRNQFLAANHQLFAVHGGNRLLLHSGVFNDHECGCSRALSARECHCWFAAANRWGSRHCNIRDRVHSGNSQRRRFGFGRHGCRHAAGFYPGCYFLDGHNRGRHVHSRRAQERCIRHRKCR
jgi:EmrB/QacA subfamily drug resistance transporter